MYLLLLSVIYLAFISLGLPYSILGAAWPTIRVEFDFMSEILVLGTYSEGGVVLIRPDKDVKNGDKLG